MNQAQITWWWSNPERIEQIKTKSSTNRGGGHVNNEWKKFGFVNSSLSPMKANY